MSNNPRPVYPNPTIAEAICELRFNLEEAMSERELFEGMQAKLQDNFPRASQELIQHFAAKISTTESGLLESTNKPVPRAIFMRDDDTQAIQLTANVMTINILPKYQGWDNFLISINTALSALATVSARYSINNISIRYINLIPRKNETDTVGQYLKANSWLPSAILELRQDFASRMQYVNEYDQHVIVSSYPAQKLAGYVQPLIFDIEAFQPQLSVIEKNEINFICDNLHTTVWNTFATSCNNELLHVLLGR